MPSSTSGVGGMGGMFDILGSLFSGQNQPPRTSRTSYAVQFARVAQARFGTKILGKWTMRPLVSLVKASVTGSLRRPRGFDSLCQVSRRPILDRNTRRYSCVQVRFKETEQYSR